MQDAYAAIVLAESPVILGRRLLPFSLGHHFALRALGSPFVTGGKIEASDTVLAVWVCSHSWQALCDKLRMHRGDIEKECKTWGRRASKDGMDVAAASTALAGYIAAHTNAPKRWSKGDASGPRVPWELAVFWKLCSGDLSTSHRRDLWDMPVPEAIAYVSAASYAAGDDSLVSEEEDEAARKLREKASHGASGNTGTN